MTHSDTFALSTKGFCDVIDITGEAEKIVESSKIKEGMVLVFVSGSTAGITTCEYEKGLIKDLEELMERLAPQNKNYYHNRAWGDDNGFSHMRASLIGPSIVLPLKDGQLQLGTWQQIVCLDFDNRPRERKIEVTVVGE